MEQNYKDAIKWLDLAAEKGDAEAQYKLGKILSETGAKYLSSSIKQGYIDAIKYSPNIVGMFEGIEKELNVQKAKNILKLSGIKNCKVGDIVEFGSYPFDKQGNVRPIEWRVLDVKDNKALLITKYGIDCKWYNEKDNDITWEDCSLRRWLNNEFYNKAFSEEEKGAIVETLVKAEENPKYRTIYPGDDTRDKVFLLNIQEAEEYFSDNKDRKCVATKYAIKNGCDVWSVGVCSWWLRSPGVYTFKAAYVGNRNSRNSNIDYDGIVNTCGISIICIENAVRPALWVYRS